MASKGLEERGFYFRSGAGRFQSSPHNALSLSREKEAGRWLGQDEVWKQLGGRKATSGIFKNRLMWGLVRIERRVVFGSNAIEILEIPPEWNLL